MKKFKFYSFITLVALALSFSLTACGDDDDNNEGDIVVNIPWGQTDQKLIGTWELTAEHSVEYVDGALVKETNEIKVDERLEFLPDATVNEYDKEFVGGIEKWVLDEKGKYTISVKDSRLNIQFPKSSIDSYAIKDFTSSILVISKTEIERKNGKEYKEIDTTTWTKVS